MKKTVFTLSVDNYCKEMTDKTHPLLKRYADKIGADFKIITERKFPNYPPVYEKMQIYDLGKGNDWNIYIDSDAVVNPDLFDITEYLTKDTVLHYGSDFASNRWTYDRYFRRDGRNIGSGNWFTIASDWCLELWEHPTDITLDEAVSRIHPIRVEEQAGLKSEHFIDDFTVARNIAKYGFKFITFLDLLKKLGRESDIYFWHQCLSPLEQKLKDVDTVLNTWGLNGK